MELGRAIVPPDPQAQHTHTIIFLHGRGDTARGFADSLFWSRSSPPRRDLKTIFPSVRWVFPQAEILYCEKLDQDWSQWFDIWNVCDFNDREHVQLYGLRDSVMSIHKLIHMEAEMVGGLDRIVLAGISQGGATAIHSLLNLGVSPTAGKMPLGKQHPSATRLAGFIGFSCRLPFPGGTLGETREILALEGKPSDDILKNTPVFLGHCANDPLVFIEWGRQLRDALDGFGMQVSWNEYLEGGHWINSPQGVDDVVEFLKAQGLKAAPREPDFMDLLSSS